MLKKVPGVLKCPTNLVAGVLGFCIIVSPCYGAVNYYEKHVDAFPVVPGSTAELDPQFFPAHDHNQKNAGTCYGFAAHFGFVFFMKSSDAISWSHWASSKLTGWSAAAAACPKEPSIVDLLSRGCLGRLQLNGGHPDRVLLQLRNEGKVSLGRFPEYERVIETVRKITHEIDPEKAIGSITGEIIRLIKTVFTDSTQALPEEFLANIVREELVRPSVDVDSLVSRVLKRVPNLVYKERTVPNYNIHLVNKDSPEFAGKPLDEAQIFSRVEQVIKVQKQPVLLTFCTRADDSGKCLGYHAVAVVGVRRVNKSSSLSSVPGPASAAAAPAAAASVAVSANAQSDPGEWEWYIYNSYGAGHDYHGWHLSGPLAKSLLKYEKNLSYLSACVPRGTFVERMGAWFQSSVETCEEGVIGAKDVFEYRIEAGDSTIEFQLNEKLSQEKNEATRKALATRYFLLGEHAMNQTLISILEKFQANFNAKFSDGSTVLTWAAEKGNFSKVRFYLGKNLDPNVPNGKGLTPLTIAVGPQEVGVSLESRAKIVELLVSKGAHLKVPTFPNGNTHLHKLLEEGNAAAVLSILSYPFPAASLGAVIDPNLPNQLGFTLVHLAIQKRNQLGDADFWRIYSRLKDLGGDINRATFPGGNTYLHKVLEEGDLETAKFISTARIFPNLGNLNVNLPNHAGFTAMHTAVRQRHLYAAGFSNIFQSIRKLDGNLDLQSFPEGRSYLLQALHERDYPTARALVDLGARLSIRDSSGKTVLHFLATAGAFGEFNHLWWREDVDLWAMDDQGKTFVHYFAEAPSTNQDEDWFKFLVRQNRSFKFDQLNYVITNNEGLLPLVRSLESQPPLGWVDSQGRPPVELAFLSGQTRKVGFFLKMGTFIPFVRIGHLTLPEYAVKQAQNFQQSMFRNLRYWAEREFGQAQYTEFEKQITLVNFLNGATPFHFASSKNQLAVIQFLLSLGGMASLLENQTVQGFTPLHFAAKRGHDQVFRALVQGGASLKTKNNDGYTPVDLLRKRQSELPFREAHAVGVLLDWCNAVQAQRDQKPAPIGVLQTVEAFMKKDHVKRLREVHFDRLAEKVQQWWNQIR